jgi:hypothetical protein
MPRDIVTDTITGQRLLDWGHVVDVAAARLEESWVSPDMTGFMMTSGLADEFAATLCAYGMAAAEADRMLESQTAPVPALGKKSPLSA